MNVINKPSTPAPKINEQSITGVSKTSNMLSTHVPKKSNQSSTPVQQTNNSPGKSSTADNNQTTVNPAPPSQDLKNATPPDIVLAHSSSDKQTVIQSIPTSTDKQTGDLVNTFFYIIGSIINKNARLDSHLGVIIETLTCFGDCPRTGSSP